MSDHRASRAAAATAACAAWVVAFVWACSDEPAIPAVAAPTVGPQALLATGVTTLALEVDYMAGAEPLTGPLVGTTGDTWRMTEVNLQRLAGRAVAVPKTLAQMQPIGAAPQPNYTAEAVLALSQAHRNRPAAAGERSVHVLFVDGQFADAAGPRPDVLAVTVAESSVVAVFVPRVRAAVQGPPGPSHDMWERFAEQTVLVHELGHALGLVGRQAPVTQPHHDSDHGAHCSAAACVMYWKNEGAADLLQFVKSFPTNDERVLFDADCLSDIDAFRADL